MSDSEYKILKAIMVAAYKFQYHHFDKKWRKILEDAEALVLEEKTKRKSINQ